VTEARTIVVVGDAAIDWYQENRDFAIRRSEGQDLPSVDLPRGWLRHETAGGSLLLDRMIHYILAPNRACRVVSPISLRGDTERAKPLCEVIHEPDYTSPFPLRGFLHSLAMVEPFKHKWSEECQWRVSAFLGFSIDAPQATPATKAVPLTIPPDRHGATADLDVLVIDDAGWSFRDAAVAREKPVWPQLLTRPIDAHPPSRGRTLIIKIGNQLPTASRNCSALWAAISERRAWFKDVIIVVNASDLRRENVDISYRLSWDRTIHDLGRASLEEDGPLTELTRLGHVVVRFDLDGAAIVPRTTAPVVQHCIRLMCDPSGIEGDFLRHIRAQFDAGHQSNLSGATTAFVAALACDLIAPDTTQQCIKEPVQGLLDPALSVLACAVTRGLEAARRLYETGLGPATNDYSTSPGFDFRKVFLRGDSKSSVVEQFRAFDIVPTAGRDAARPLVAAIGPTAELAYKFALTGNEVLANVPILQYGGFLTADAREIEKYRAVANLIETHLASEFTKRPLSIAVFGPPGAGKSFGVKSVATSLGGERVRVIEANVAQFTSRKDLTRELHSARDEVLRGRIPLLIFDEFDSTRKGRPRAWMRMFLEPMQDGKFVDDGREHAIERAIFVFAGGTAKSLEEFYDPETAESDQVIRDQKLPDFVSRLHGVIDVLGPNPGPRDPSDALYTLRRAILLRAKLYQYGKNLFQGSQDGPLRIAEHVLRAFLTVPKYHHGARSMEAIIRMSGITPAVESFEEFMLPPRDQLQLHVDAKEFEARLRM
jgi:ATPase family associated with various cellular activities (AAA)